MPKSSRPRERFLEKGASALSDAELFAILLRTGTRGSKKGPAENAIEMSNRLIAEFGLNKLFECSLKELQEIKGIGQSKSMQILVMNEILKRINSAKTPVIKINSAKDVFDLFHERLKDEKQENFYILMLNTQNNIIGEQLVSKGILDASIVHPREVFKAAIKNSASKIILVHNHPSGSCEPSKEDLEITKLASESGELLNIQLRDHLIIGKDKYWSWFDYNQK